MNNMGIISGTYSWTLSRVEWRVREGVVDDQDSSHEAPCAEGPSC